MDEGLMGEKAVYIIFLQTWWQFIERYIPSNISDERDKSPAINGMEAPRSATPGFETHEDLWCDFLKSAAITYTELELELAPRAGG